MKKTSTKQKVRIIDILKILKFKLYVNFVTKIERKVANYVDID